MDVIICNEDYRKMFEKLTEKAECGVSTTMITTF